MSPYIRVHVSRYDTDFQILLLLFSSAGEFEIESGTTATIRGTKPDGSSYEKTCYMTGKSVLLQGDENLTDVAGIGRYEICLTHNGKMLHSSNLYLEVEPAAAERD